MVTLRPPMRSGAELRMEKQAKGTRRRAQGKDEAAEGGECPSKTMTHDGKHSSPQALVHVSARFKGDKAKAALWVQVERRNGPKRGKRGRHGMLDLGGIRGVVRRGQRDVS